MSFHKDLGQSGKDFVTSHYNNDGTGRDIFL